MKQSATGLRAVLCGVLLIAAFAAHAAAPALETQSARRERVEFMVTDEPGRWFKNTKGPIAGTYSLAVAKPGVEVKFSGHSHTVHTMTSLLYPTGAKDMPFDTHATKHTEKLILNPDFPLAPLPNGNH